MRWRPAHPYRIPTGAGGLTSPWFLRTITKARSKMLKWLHSKRAEEAAGPAKLVVGLGNPGRAHATNRHNVGFQVLDSLAKRHDLSFDRIESQASMACGELAGLKVILLKPLTYMNQSGMAVKPAVSQYTTRLEDLLVICDDLDLPLGNIRLRDRGGAGGHKGMRSIISSLGTQSLPRLRIGIGRPEGAPAERYVLQDFSPDECITMEKAFDKAADAVECFLTEGIAAAMNTYN